MLELRQPEGAFARIEAYLRERGFFAPGGEDLEADLYLGYGLSAPLRRHASPLPPEPCPLPLRGSGDSGRVGSWPRQSRADDVRIGDWERTLERRGVRARSRGGARGDRARRRLPGQSRPAPERGLRAAIRPRSPSASRHSGRGTLAGDGWAIVSASPELFLARRGRRVWTSPIKGTRPLGEHVEGEKDSAEHVMIVDLERNDLSRVCEPGSVRWPELMVERELAGVTHLVSTVEGTAARGRRPGRAAGGDLPGRLRHRSAQDRRRRPDRRARAGRPRRLDGRARRRARQRRPRARADDPHLRDRRRARSTSGSAAGSSGTPTPEAEIEESWTKAAPAAGGDRRAGRGGGAVSLLAVAVGGRGVVDPAEPVLRADDEALLRGRGAFETIRVYGGAQFPPPRASGAARELGGDESVSRR